MKKNELIERLENRKARSAWSKGVKEFAIDMVYELDAEEIEVETKAELKEMLLNGARDWSEYSYGGSGLIYDYDIAKALCTPSELKKTKDGERQPNRTETWLDVQAMALHQACNIIMREYVK